MLVSLDSPLYRKRYPAGVQSFEALRENNQIYVDKTQLIYELANSGTYYFLSRPRRFGKSLLLSTIKAYFEGRKELFDGLAISRYETEWRQYPVIRIDLSAGMFNHIDNATTALRAQVRFNAEDLSVSIEAANVVEAFQELIRKSHDKYGEKVVVLIDEYDKPLLETMHQEEDRYSEMQTLMRGFYGCLKESSQYLRFVFITGITKFSHVNIFSGLNNLTDLSLESWCNDICGISETEMQQYFADDIAKFGELNGMTPAEAADKFRLYYDGYRFAKRGENIYNPYSVIRALSSMDFGQYWFQSGSSKNMIKALASADFDFTELEGKVVNALVLMGAPTTDGNPIGLLYQAGYLTIKEYIGDDNYKVGFPNKEVSSAFYNELLNVLFPDTNDKGFSINKVRAAASSGDPHGLVHQLTLGLSEYVRDQTKDIDTEAVFNSLLYGLCKGIGFTTRAEYHTSNGRIDLVIETARYIYLFEIKIDKSAEAAMHQINEKGYANKYYGDTRTLFKIGMKYDTTKQHITDSLIYTRDNQKV